MDSYLKRERSFVATFLLILSFMVARSLRHIRLAMCNGFCPADLGSHRIAPAPEAYRVALPAIERVINILLHLKDGTLAGTAIDFISGFLTLYILYILAVEGFPLTQQAIASRMAVLGIFLAFIQFPISFIFFLQRMETLPTALFVAVALLSLSRAKKNPWWIILLFLATAIQAFTRADVPFIFGLALMILSCCGNLLQDFGSRNFNLLLGTGVTLISGGIQSYLKFILMPHLPYATGSPIVIQYNVKWNVFNIFFLAVLPFLLLIVPAVRQRRRLSSVEVIAIGASVLYLPLLFTVALVSEVRIYVPFLLALCLVAARILSSYLLPAGLQPGHSETSIAGQ